MLTFSPLAPMKVAIWLKCHASSGFTAAMSYSRQKRCIVLW
jgi:hypothetical protein